jgi:hypothetical protein
MELRASHPTFLLLLFFFISGCVSSPPAPPVSPGPKVPALAKVSEPEFLYLVPTYGVFFVPGTSGDVLFYDGLWYYRVKGTWYWSRTYKGPWNYMGPNQVPLALRKLPSDYRTRYRLEHYRVPFDHWTKRWTEPPPPTRYGEPGYLYKIQGSGVFAYPEISAEVYYYGDRWYSRYKGLWYWSWSYNGPWAYLEAVRTPAKVRELPRLKQNQKHYKRVPWGKAKRVKEEGKDAIEDWKP